MPLHLEPLDLFDELQGYSSVLIVSCPVCPPASLASDNDSPFIELFKHGIKTSAFEDHIQSIRDSLEGNGVRTGVFSIHTPTPMMCLWTKGQRERLLKRAGDYEAVLILACDSGTESAKDALKDTDCKVFQALDMDGVINATTSIHFPLTVVMERHDESNGAGQVT